MRVLVACEFSGTVREAFRVRGHDAWSCDLLDSEKPGPHLRRDVLDVLRDIEYGVWDLLIAHPPCTHIAIAGARWFPQKRDLQEKALDFCERLWRAPVKRIALENPRSVLSSRIGKRTQAIHPWQFGHAERKETWFWLKNLPLLVPTRVVEKPVCGPKQGNSVFWAAPGPDRWKERSRTFQGIADAMAEQWGALG